MPRNCKNKILQFKNLINNHKVLYKFVDSIDISFFGESLEFDMK